ncbi:MAG: endonuclease [Bacilli bacterium]|nr:endonuclease [Bacilli bacterium]
MKKIFKILGFIPLLLSFSFTSSPKRASSTFKTSTYYDSTKALDFTDSTESEIEAYYGDIGTLTGDDLMSYLYNIIKCDTADLSKYYLTYGSGLSGVGKWYQITDRNWSISDSIDPLTFEFVTSPSDEDNDSFRLYNMYMTDSSNNNSTKAISNVVNGFDKDTTLSAIDYTNKKKPNSYIQVDKEHVWAKNHGFKVTSNGKDTFVPGAPTDLHHLVAADHNTNSAGHNDYMYGEVDHSTAKTIYSYLGDGTTEVSGWLDSSSETFEPTDEWKGDVARCLLYMATRYSNKLDQNTQAEPYLYITDDTSYKDDDNTAFHGVQYNLSDLLDWNELDPVSDYEVHRNNLIYKNVQQNRNPYIDHPEWARRVYDSSYVLDDLVSQFEASQTQASLSFNYTADVQNEQRDATMVASELGLENVGSFTSTTVDNDVTISVLSGDSNGYPSKYYTSNETLRIYNKNVITISTPTNAMTRIVFNTVSEHFTTGKIVSITGGAVSSYSSGVLTITPSAASVSIGVNDKVFISSIVVTRMTSTSSYTGFNSPQLKFKYTCDLSAQTFDESGIYITENTSFDYESVSGTYTESTIAAAFGDYGTRKSVNTKTATQTYWTVGVNIAEADYETVLNAAAYLKVDGTYYFAKPKAYSVKTILLAYQSEDLTTSEMNAVEAFYDAI